MTLPAERERHTKNVWDNVKGRHNLTIFLDNFSTNFRQNSTRKIARWFKELINLNHLTIFITEFHQKLVEKLSKKIQLSPSRTHRCSVSMSPYLKDVKARLTSQYTTWIKKSNTKSFWFFFLYVNKDFYSLQISTKILRNIRNKKIKNTCYTIRKYTSNFFSSLLFSLFFILFLNTHCFLNLLAMSSYTSLLFSQDATYVTYLRV